MARRRDAAARSARGATSDDRFWYRVSVQGGAEFILVDPARGTKERAFDHEKLAAALSTAASGRYSALTLPFTEIELPADGRTVEFAAAKRRWSCDRQGSQCTARGEAPSRTERPRRRQRRARFRHLAGRQAGGVRP